MACNVHPPQKTDHDTRISSSQCKPIKIQIEFVCIPRPISRATTADGGKLRYRVRHTAQKWTAGKRPELVQEIVEGDPGLSA
jgi:alkaline phosphatase D